MDILAKTIVDYAMKNSDGTYGRIDDEKTPFIKLNEGIIGKNPVLILVTIFIPEHMSHKGLCTYILNELEIKATENHMHFQVGPFMTEDSEYIIKILKRKNFQSIPPFSMIKPFIK